MKRSFCTPPSRCRPAAAVVLAMVLAVSASGADDPSLATLRWRNGDTLPGRLLEVNRSRIHWQSPFFASTFWVELDSVQSATFPRGGVPARVSEPHRFTMKNGDVFCGRLVDLTDDDVVVKSERHGECRISRSLVLGFRRCDHARYASFDKLYLGRSRVVLFDGTSVHGEVRRLDRSTGALIVEESTNDRRALRIADLAAVYLGDDTGVRGVTGKPRIQIAYHDGTRLRGNVKSSAPGKLLLDTIYSGRAVACPLAGIRELTFLGDEEPVREPTGVKGLMQLEGGTLHVRLAEGDESDGALRWRLVGSMNASSLVAGRPANVTFDAAKEVPAAESEGSGEAGSSDVLYLRNGDVVPGRVVSADQSHVRVQPAFAPETSIPRSQVKAIEFDIRLRLPVSGFGDRGWTVTGAARGAVERTDEQVVFRGPGTLRHMSVLHGDEVRFDVEWNTDFQTTISIDPFTSELQSRQPGVLLYLIRDQLLVRRLQRQGELIRMVAMHATSVRDGRASVRIALEDDTLRISVEDRLIVSQPFPEKERIGDGLVLSVQQPRARVRVGAVTPDVLTISNFEVGRPGEVVRGLRVDEEKKKLVLTVPRQRKKNPPTHVLVGGNRDLLRGRLVGVSGDDVHFISRMDELTVPRERLDGIIWLDKVEGTEARSSIPTEGTVRVLLTNGAALTFTPERAASGKIVGRSALLGMCRVLVGAIHQLIIGDATKDDQPVAYADWKLVAAREPQFADPSAGGGPSRGSGLDSPLVGKAAGTIAVELLGGGRFDLRDHLNKVVILDFWATWCGPCVRALPQMMKTAESFPRDQVLLVAVNQQESSATVREFLKRRGWDLQVVLDRDGRIGREYQVDAIPQTVVIGKSGKIEWLHVGAHPDLQKTLEEVLRKLVASEPSEKAFRF